MQNSVLSNTVLTRFKGIRLRYPLLAVLIVGFVIVTSALLPPPQCDLFQHCTTSVAALNK